MKKILSVILSIIMVFSLMSVGAVNAADNTATVSLSNAIGNPGSTVSVKVNINNNPGIIAMAFCVAYDKNAFEYVDYSKGYLTNYTVTNHADLGIVSFVSVEEDDVSISGTMLTLKFKIKPSAQNGEYTVSIKNNNPDKYGNSLHNSFANKSEQFIEVNATDGIITVTGKYDALIGDVNVDGNVNNKDLALLMQYVNGWDVQILASVADVNGDGGINNKDLALLMQYVNGWDVQLGTKA